MAMADHVEMALKQALALPVAERAALIEKLMNSLGQPDTVTDGRSAVVGERNGGLLLPVLDVTPVTLEMVNVLRDEQP